MAKKKGANATQKAHYTTYKDQQKWKANRIKRLQRHLVKYPGDKNARAVLENPDRMVYRRNVKTSGNLKDKKNTPKVKYLATLMNEVKQLDIGLPMSFRDKMKMALGR